ncbi:exosortase F system-associated protein [uncultured Nonlabens sp.]|uniref:exosortase F system-associated membrane protein n=1 Tax=uncultured Nonlabens sp. TaxID=859306 RepID=UPI00260AE72B|nr:exosortase F system-associated protein [uncultured Nonlabens sp.]
MILIISVLILGLISVRVFESYLFYDPFNFYFKNNFQNISIPNFSIIKLLSSFTLRFLINLILALSIIWFLYRSKSFIKATFWVNFTSYLILLTCFMIFSEFDYNWIKMLLFYIRRFLIHPILLLILIPGFYFIKFIKTKNQ